MRALFSGLRQCVGLGVRFVKRMADTVRRFRFCVKDGMLRMLRMWVLGFGEEGCEAEGELGWGG